MRVRNTARDRHNRRRLQDPDWPGLGRPVLRMNFEDRKHLQQEELKRQARWQGRCEQQLRHWESRQRD